ncbi:MAG: methyltransferase, partial [Stackebrandtia sp.]
MADIEPWTALGSKLEVSTGVHRPSTFSAFLAATMADSDGQTVVDAGCGAGLVTMAALAAGARHVVAQDYDAAALADTVRNVEEHLGGGARARLSLWESDWRQLAVMHADVLVVNPPQRPAAVLPDVPAEERHLHEGGGADGLDGIRLVLEHAGTTRVRTTAAAVLDITALRFRQWSAPRTV